MDGSNSESTLDLNFWTIVFYNPFCIRRMVLNNDDNFISSLQWRPKSTSMKIKTQKCNVARKNRPSSTKIENWFVNLMLLLFPWGLVERLIAPAQRESNEDCRNEDIIIGKMTAVVSVKDQWNENELHCIYLKARSSFVSKHLDA